MLPVGPRSKPLDYAVEQKRFIKPKISATVTIVDENHAYLFFRLQGRC